MASVRLLEAAIVVAALAACSAGCSSGPTAPRAVGLGISAISPSTAPSAGGTIVSITGQNFLATTNVRFGSVPATSVQLVSSTTLAVTTPAHPPGVVDVVVTSGGGTASLTGGFTYLP